MFEEPLIYVQLVTGILILGFVVQYSAKILANNNGLKICWFMNHFRDYSNMYELIRNGKTQRIQLLAKVHLTLLSIFAIFMLSLYFGLLYLMLNEPAFIQSLLQLKKS